MRVFELWVCFMVMLTSIPFISSSSLPDMIFPVYESSTTAALTHNRKLMEKNNKDIGNVNLEDYRVDPPPSFKAPITPGPILDPPPSSKSPTRTNKDIGNVNLEDYRVDPPPSSKAPINYSRTNP